MKKSGAAKSGKSKKRSGTEKVIVVLADAAGNYYELSRATLERSRVSADRKAAVEAAFKKEVTDFWYIPFIGVPGSVTSGKPKVQLKYAGSYLKSARPKRS
ncbi:MAG: hypothetical protein ACXWHF_00270 [Chthoniobacterales bacterium]